MCTNPIIMRNPAKNRYGGMEYIKVPCRNCPECAISAQQDYTCRAIALWNSLPIYYNAYFCTLTFNNQNLPNTSVYERMSDGFYKVVADNVPCFNHALYQRFRKNFLEFILDVFKQRAYILTTCEFGEKRHRPHYHCIIFVPYYNDWRHFKSDLERFWHYGFTMDKCITTVDGISYRRSFLNSIKYVTKYVCKFNQWLPFYLKSDKYVTDFSPYDIKPRVFCSKNFGSVLENSLTEENYRLNNIYLSVKGDKQDVGKSFSLPAYYRRRKHITTVVLSQSVNKRYWYDVLVQSLNDGVAPPPYIKSVLNRPKVERHVVTFRSDIYCKYLYDDFKKSLSQRMFKYDYLIRNNPDFKLFILDKFSSCDLNYSDLYYKICNIYLERHNLSFLSSLSLPYHEKVEKISKTHYLIPKGLNIFQAKKHFYSTQQQLKDNGLSFCDYRTLPFTHFRTLKFVPYTSLPPAYYKLEYMDSYCRKHRIKQYELQYQKDIEWYKIHSLPFQISA